MNPADLELQAGYGESTRDACFQVVSGWDVTGIVEAVGDGVTEYHTGDEVIA